MLSTRSSRRLPTVSGPAAGVAGRSSSPVPATVPPTWPATPASASMPATCRKLRRPTGRSGAPTSMFSSGSSLPARTILDLLQLSRSHDDLVDQQRVAGRDRVGHDLQPQRAGGGHGVGHDDPPPLQAG